MTITPKDCEFCNSQFGQPQNWLHIREGSWYLCDYCGNMAAQLLGKTELEHCLITPVMAEDRPAELNPFTADFPKPKGEDTIVIKVTVKEMEVTWEAV